MCSAPGATAACQFVRLCSADRLDNASAQQLLYAIRGAKRRAHLGGVPAAAQHATEVRARAAALVAETRALAQRCTVASDRQALLRASAALAEVVLSNGGRVLTPTDAPGAAPAAGEERRGSRGSKGARDAALDADRSSGRCGLIVRAARGELARRTRRSVGGDRVLGASLRASRAPPHVGSYM